MMMEAWLPCAQFLIVLVLYDDTVKNERITTNLELLDGNDEYRIELRKWGSLTKVLAQRIFTNN